MRKKTITAIVISVFAVSLWAVPTAGAWFAVANAANSPTTTTTPSNSGCGPRVCSEPLQNFREVLASL